MRRQAPVGGDTPAATVPLRADPFALPARLNVPAQDAGMVAVVDPAKVVIQRKARGRPPMYLTVPL